METPAGQLSRELIDQKLVELASRERELTRRLADMFANNARGLGLPKTMSRREPTKQERLKTILNGAGGLVCSVSDTSETEGDLFEQRQDVRDSIKLLEGAKTAVITAANAEWVRAHAAEYDAIMKGLVLALASARRLHERAIEFVDRAHLSGVDLRLSQHIGQITIGVSPINLDIFLSEALAARVVTEAELKGAGIAKR